VGSVKSCQALTCVRDTAECIIARILSYVILMMFCKVLFLLFYFHVRKVGLREVK
jgi:hypothetical protein